MLFILLKLDYTFTFELSLGSHVSSQAIRCIECVATGAKLGALFFIHYYSIFCWSIIVAGIIRMYVLLIR